MSKGIVFLATASAAMLVAAGGAVLLLLWQTWEDGRLLEIKNRELQASLEASRIRVENFCEYPMDAICPVDTPGGRHGTVLPPMEIPSPALVTAGQDPSPSAAMPADPQQASDEGKNDADVPTATASPAIPDSETAERPRMPDQVSPPEQSRGEQDLRPLPPPEADVHSNDAGGDPLPPESGGGPSALAMAARDSLNAEKEPVPAMTSETPQIQGTEISPQAELPDSPPAATDSTAKDAVRLPENAVSHAEKAPIQPSDLPANEDNARREDPQPVPQADERAENAPGAAGTPEEAPGAALAEQTPMPLGDSQVSERQVPPDPQAVQMTPQRTWTTLDHGAEGMLFRIAGSGNELRARGELLPEKYVVTIDGLWKVFQRQPSTPCVQGMRRSFVDGRTILEFPLRRPPRLCRVTQENARTIAIEIR